VSSPPRPTAPPHLTYQHLAAILATEQGRGAGEGPVRVLDAGCGEGGLVGFLHTTLPRLRPEVAWELHGFDVVDSTSTRTHRPDFPRPTLDHLDEVDPAVPWAERIRAVASSDPWPHADGSFPFVVTNQVLEHVVDAGAFLRQVHRVLAPGGVCVNLFPLAGALLEGHLLVPFAGQVQGREQRAAWLRASYRAGLGKPAHRTRGRAAAEEDAEYLDLATSYRSWTTFVALARRVGLRISYRYTGELYRQKLRQAAGRPPLERYRRDRNAVLDWTGFVTLRHLASITLVLERPGAGSPHLRGPAPS
jgi:SAM-dependent methyltransferase